MLAYWVHDLNPNIIQFTDTIAIRWYGIAYVLGFLAAMFLLWLYYKKGRSPFDNNQQSTLITALILGALIGGRLGYMVLYDFQTLVNNPLVFFKVWQGGMSSHGGFVGVGIAIFWISRSTKTLYLQISDIIVTLVPPGLFFGRIANFINAELWGKPSFVPWAIIFPGSTPINGEYVPRHPSQLYEALLEGVVLTIYMQFRFWHSRNISAQKQSPGQLTGEFLFFYSVLRIFCEIFREADAGLIFGLSRGIFYSLFTFVAGITFIVIARRNES
jgi:phosphatidylglycerol---prolipoprotein diacylglyceryl transferase